MQYVDLFHEFDFLPMASNDNDDLLAIDTPESNLSIIRSLKNEMREENALNGLLLRSRRKRKFFQEIQDAEVYILLRYFTAKPDYRLLRKLKRHILDHYLFPRVRPV